MRNVKPVL
ncbi:hypothetical protein Zm00014a_008909 [Zea mays]|uniref:Uncharacterized protein n=1 Tax=Zea mays TaxID=4577 RepID=A0A317YHA4_MAIZE|nr:hypothetical protein Zm00014a_008909 [Zea mays]